MSENAKYLTTHKCRFLLQDRSPYTLDPTIAETVFSMLHAMPLARQVSICDPVPAKAVRAGATRFGVDESQPVGLVGYMLEKWLRLTLRYVTGNIILLPIDSGRTWGRRISGEVGFEYAGREAMQLADAFLRAYQDKYTGPEAMALVASRDTTLSAQHGLTWEWNDGEDMVSRIVDAPRVQDAKANDLAALTDVERAVLHDHFAMGFNLSEIIVHLGIAPYSVFEEYAAWTIEEQKEFERLEAEDGDRA